jgi:hypothetical protein
MAIEPWEIWHDFPILSMYFQIVYMEMKWMEITPFLVPSRWWGINIHRPHCHSVMPFQWVYSFSMGIPKFKAMRW